MARTPASPIAIEYETFGEPTAPPVLLVMGLGGQLIHWDEAFCRLLAGLGRYVIRFDNRDVGLSTKLDDLHAPDAHQSVLARLEGRSISAPYTLDDMADDAVGLLDWLGIAKAHVVGTSMGGMIAQCMAIRHPSRLLSLTSIMADAGEPVVPEQEAMIAFEPPPMEREAYATQIVQTLRALCGPRFPLDEQGARQVVLKAFERGVHPAGFARQLAAIFASGSRREALGSVAIPTLVIHGDADPMVPLAGGIQTAQAIPDAKLHIIEGMGHELPPAEWPEVIEAIGVHTSFAAISSKEVSR
jgi:pimeloyl-ACP methyl ester carboxylesterase